MKQEKSKEEQVSVHKPLPDSIHHRQTKDQDTDYMDSTYPAKYLGDHPMVLANMVYGIISNSNAPTIM
jgi:hypothetical protein